MSLTQTTTSPPREGEPVRIVDRASAYGMEVSTEKGKTRTYSTNTIGADISTNRRKLEVTSFENLGATLCKDGTCSAEIRNRTA